MSAAILPKAVEYRSLDFLGYPKYRVGDDGSVWSSGQRKECRNRKDGRCHEIDGVWHRLSPGVQSSGHQHICLRNECGPKYFRVHCLVLSAFVGPCPYRMEACHFPDVNPANNKLSNLKWGTRLENFEHRVLQGTAVRGSKHPRAKVNEEDVREMRRLREAGWYLREIGNKFGLKDAAVSSIMHGKNWSHVL